MTEFLHRSCPIYGSELVQLGELVGLVTSADTLIAKFHLENKVTLTSC